MSQAICAFALPSFLSQALCFVFCVFHQIKSNTFLIFLLVSLWWWAVGVNKCTGMGKVADVYSRLCHPFLLFVYRTAAAPSTPTQFFELLPSPLVCRHFIILSSKLWQCRQFYLIYFIYWYEFESGNFSWVYRVSRSLFLYRSWSSASLGGTRRLGIS